LRIPEDISVVGHDNLEMSTHVRPKLTTVDTHKDRLGRAGVDLLMEEIHAGDPLGKEVVYPTELVVRGSTRKWGPVPGNKGA
jgi:LacI family transcriptional regulator